MKVAVVGSGIAGLGAAFQLDGRHEVEVFEAGPRAGGHVHTVSTRTRRGTVEVDLGFIVCNRENYPRFFALLRELGIATRPTSMSFSVVLPAQDLEWSSASLDAVFADRARLFDLGHWRFLADVLRFLARGRRDLRSGRVGDASLDQWLDACRIPTSVREQFVVPLAAALWSLAPARCGAFPAHTYLRFMDQHGMLRPTRPLAWHTIVGGSRRYVEALLARLTGPVHTDTPVERIHRDAHGVTLTVAGRERRFDRVVVATHADVALRLLADPTADERAVLGAFRYSRNRVVLHGDARELPSRRRAWASWNYRADPDRGQVAVTYWMNQLQGLPDHELQLVTLNPRGRLADERHEAWFDHPQLDLAARAAAAAMPALQGQRHTYYAGAHLGFGFHEDGLRAGQQAAAVLCADGTRLAAARRVA